MSLIPRVECRSATHEPTTCNYLGSDPYIMDSLTYECPVDKRRYTVIELDSQPFQPQEDSAVSEQPDPANAMPAPDTAPVGPPPETDSPPPLAPPTGTDTSPVPLLQPVGEPSQPDTTPTASAPPADSSGPSKDDTHEDAFGRKIKGGQAEHLHAWVTRSVVDDPNVGPITVTECVDCGARVVS